MNESTVFRIGNKGGFFDLLVRLTHPAQTKGVKYDIFRLENGKESYEATYKQEISESSTWFEKELTFLKGGDYNIYVYTDEDKLLCVGKVKVIIKEK
jgi:hypothetical protein